MSLAKVIPLHTNQLYHSRRRELGIKRERIALSCKGITKHGRLCGNQTTNNPAYCRQHIEQAPGGTVYESMLAERREELFGVMRAELQSVFRFAPIFLRKMPTEAAVTKLENLIRTLRDLIASEL